MLPNHMSCPKRTLNGANMADISHYTGNGWVLVTQCLSLQHMSEFRLQMARLEKHIYTSVLQGIPQYH